MYLHNEPTLGEERITAGRGRVKLVHLRGTSSGIAIAPETIGAFGEPARPLFNIVCPSPPGCALFTAAQCRGLIREAGLEAIRLASNAAVKVEAATALRPDQRDAEARTTARLFRFFFGHDPKHPVPWAGNQASGVSVASRFRAVARELGGGRRITFQCLPTVVGCGNTLTCCDSDVNAWVHPDLPNTINLCTGFWNPPVDLHGLPGRNFRAAVIIHEMLHLLYGEFLGDVARGRPRAACYEAFALRVAGFGADPADVCRCTRGAACPM